MKIVSINDFTGGMAEEPREARADTFVLAQGWDIVTSKAQISNYPAMITEAYASPGGTVNGAYMSDAIAGTDPFSQTLAALGNTIGDQKDMKMYFKNSMVPSQYYANYTNSAIGTGSLGATGWNTMCVYKNKWFAMFLPSANTSADVFMYTRNTTTMTNLGTISSPTNTNSGLSQVPGVKPYVHSQSGIIYFANGSTVAQYDNSTFTASAFTVDAELAITSLSEYGPYLAIGCEPRNPGGRSKVYLWNLDTGNTRAQEILDFGPGLLRVLENVNGELVGISSNASNIYVRLRSQIQMRIYNGGQPRLVRAITGSLANNFTLYQYKTKKDNFLYFAAQVEIAGINTHQIWVAGKNDKGNYFLSADQYVAPPGSVTVTGIVGIGAVGDYMWAGSYSASTNYFMRTTEQTNSYETATLITLINPKMALSDRKLKKKLNGFFLSSPTGGTFAVSLSVDGGAFAEIFNGTVLATVPKEITAFADGSHFKEGKEFQFKIVIPTGSTQTTMTEIGYWYDLLKTQIPISQT